MSLHEVARIPLPAHGSEGEFDHAAVDLIGDRLYVAHPTRDAVEIIDLERRSHAGTIPGLRGVAGVWVDAGARRLFTSNRGEDSVSIFELSAGRPRELHRLPTGVRPNGLAFDPARQLLMVAGVGNRERADAPPTLTFIDARLGSRLGQHVVPGRTRWALYHTAFDQFFVNVADPPSILGIAADDIAKAARAIPIPSQGPHGLEQHPDARTAYCACDEGVLWSVDLQDGRPTRVGVLSGPPDVLWAYPGASRLFCAIGDPGTVDVFDLHAATGPLERYRTAPGAHTLTVDPRRGELHVFLPETHEDLVLSVKDA